METGHPDYPRLENGALLYVHVGNVLCKSRVHTETICKSAQATHKALKRHGERERVVASARVLAGGDASPSTASDAELFRSGQTGNDSCVPDRFAMLPWDVGFELPIASLETRHVNGPGNGPSVCVPRDLTPQLNPNAPR